MKPESIVAQFLKRKKETHPSYSMRALARDLKVSPSFFSEVMSGKKKMPAKWIKPLARLLSLDNIGLADLKTAVLLSHVEGTDLEELIDVKSAQVVSKANLSKPLDARKISVLSKWYYIGILDFLTLSGGPFSEQEIATRLELSVAAVREALEALQRLSLITIDKENGPQKTDQHIRFPTSKTDPTIRNFHVQMIDKAKYELLRKTDDQAFQKRLITGTTMAVDPKHAPLIKQKIQHFMAEIAQEFSDGVPQELYQLNVQLFPLSKSKK